MEKNITQEEHINLKKEFEKKEKSMEERLWIDSNVGKFDDVLRGNYNKSVEDFSEVIIEYLSQITNAYQGIFYIVDQENKIIEAVAGYACNLDKLEKKEFEFGEDLIGQSVLSRDKIVFEDLPSAQEDADISEVIFSPKALIVMPLLFNKSVYGVLKFVFLKPIEEKLKLLLDRACQNIGAMLESIINNGKLQELLEDTQSKADQMKAQEEELRQNLEEMAATREAQERVQAKLTETQLRFELATETTSEGLWEVVFPDDLVTDDDTEIWWSDRFREMTGFTDEKELPNKLGSFTYMLHPDDRDRVLGAFQAHLMDLSGKTPYDVEYRSLQKAGGFRWYRARGNTKRDENGKPLRIVGSLIDIQESKDLAVSQEKFDLATSTTSEGLWDVFVPDDMNLKDDTEVWWSINFIKMLGYKDEKEFPGYLGYWTKLLHPDDLNRVFEALNNHMNDFSGKTPYNIDYRLLHKVKGYRWYRVSANTVRNDDGKPVRMVGSLIDIQKEKDFELGKEKYEMTLEATTEGLWYINLPEGLDFQADTPFMWSDRFRQLLGYQDESDFPNTFGAWTSKIHPDHQERVLEEVFAHLTDLTGNTPYDIEYMLLLKSGEYRWFRAIGKTARDAEGNPLRTVGTVVDIQESKDFEALKIKQQALLEISHEGSWSAHLSPGEPFTFGSEVNWSTNVLTMLGFGSAEEFPARFESLTSRVHGNDIKSVSDGFQRLLGDGAEEDRLTLKFRLKLKSGEYHRFKLNVKRQLSDGRVSILGNLIDLDELIK